MFNGNSGYGANQANSVTGTDKAPTLSLVTWCLPVNRWRASTTMYGTG